MVTNTHYRWTSCADNSIFHNFKLQLDLLRGYGNSKQLPITFGLLGTPSLVTKDVTVLGLAGLGALLVCGGGKLGVWGQSKGLLAHWWREMALMSARHLTKHVCSP